jgi:hypothetical protein
MAAKTDVLFVGLVFGKAKKNLPSAALSIAVLNGNYPSRAIHG